MEKPQIKPPVLPQTTYNSDRIVNINICYISQMSNDNII